MTKADRTVREEIEALTDNARDAHYVYCQGCIDGHPCVHADAIDAVIQRALRLAQQVEALQQQILDYSDALAKTMKERDEHAGTAQALERQVEALTKIDSAVEAATADRCECRFVPMESDPGMKQLSSCTFHDSLVEAARNEGEMVAARAIVIKADQEREAAFRRGTREAALRIMNARLWAYEAQQICQEYADPQPEERKP